MKIETSELQGAALDWAVAKCEVTEPIEEFDYFFLKNHDNGFCYYSMNWAQGGPIIEREGLCLNYDPFSKRWNCSTKVLDSYQAETPLIAAMRCYVASKLGDEVEIPEGLV
jgi:hypothetical protein